MASPEAIRALRRILYAAIRTPAYQQQRRTICTECLARPHPGRWTTTKRMNMGVGQHITSKQVADRRSMATVSKAEEPKSRTHGPIAEYDARVASGRLRDDPHQRNLIQSLQDLHETLAKYHPPKVIHPTIESLQPKKPSLFGSLFGGASKEAESSVKLEIPESLPKGLYMYGDVGSGKTMLMDLFYETLPPNITAKSRIHFHNFMQDVHKELHKMKVTLGNDMDVIPYVAANIAEKASILCFDEFQCTDVADAMILRRLIESLMHHGTVLVTTSNRHPTELYLNGIQRQSFLPCIALLTTHLTVLNLDSTTDYRKIPRPPSGVYHHPLDSAAARHAEHWFRFLGDFEHDPPHPAVQHVWGRDILVPRASGRAACFTFNELIGRATGAADYLELARSYDAFIVTDVPGMNLRSRDLARRFITFLDAVYESRARLVLTTAVPIAQLFTSRTEVDDVLEQAAKLGKKEAKEAKAKVDAGKEEDEGEGAGVNDAMRSLMDDLGMNMESLKKSSIFTGDEESFAFARALSRLVEMGSREWVERGLGLEKSGGLKEKQDWDKVRGHWRQDSY